MKIHIPANENIIDALQNVVDFLKSQKDDCKRIGGTGANLYFTLQSIEGIPNEWNHESFVIKDGEVKSCLKFLAGLCYQFCVDDMLRLVNKYIYYYSHLDKDIKSLENKAETIRAKIENTVKETSISRYKKSLEKIELEIAKKNEDKTVAEQQISLYRKIRDCIRKRKYTWTAVLIPGKTEYDIKSVVVRPVIDKYATVFKKPLFFYDGYFSWEDLDDKAYWYSLNRKIGFDKNLMSLAYSGKEIIVD